MKFHTALTIAICLVVFAGTAQAAQMLSAPSQGLATPSASSQTLSAQTQGFVNPFVTQVQIAERLFTPAVLEPNGFVAVCFATNLDTVARDLAAQIIDSRGVDVTQFSSCGARQTAGVTCDSTAQFSNNSPLRCIVGTSGKATSLRGGMTTSSGPFPFVSPANLTITAQ